LKAINPWTWQDQFDFSQGVLAPPGRVLFCAGQTAVDPDGRPQHAGNMAAQLDLAFDNLERVLGEAGMSLPNVARLNFYVTDMAAFRSASHVVKRRLAGVDCKPSGTLLGVATLFHPAILVELEATAVG